MKAQQLFVEFTKNFHKNDMKLLSRDGKCSVGNIFGVSDICNQKRRVKWEGRIIFANIARSNVQ